MTTGLYPARSLPRIDYRRHPEYSGLYETIGAAERVAATGILLPVLARHLLAIGQRRWTLPPRVSKAAVREADLAEARDAGIVVKHLPAAWKRKLEVALDPKVGMLDDTGSARAFVRTDVSSRLSIDEPPLLDMLGELLGDVGIMELARVITRRRRVRIGDAFVQSSLASGRPRGRAADLHVDYSFRTAKVIIYLSEVGAQNGPFRYIRGSHRVARSLLDHATRMAIAELTQAGDTPEQRRFFCALPTVFRRRAMFGADMHDDDPSLPAILANEQTVTSADGDLVLFDNGGIHRGGAVEQGRRTVLQLLLS